MTAAVLALAIIVGGLVYATEAPNDDNSHIHICVGVCSGQEHVEPCGEDHE